MDVKPWWMRRTVWASVGGFVTAASAFFAPDSKIGLALLALAAVFGNIAALTARAGGVAAAEAVVDNLPTAARNAVKAGVAGEAKLRAIDKKIGEL